MSNISSIKIKGALKVISTEVIQSPAVIGSVVLAKDEDGVVWNISGRTFPFDMKPYRLPSDYRASYCFEAGIHTVVVQAFGEIAARKKILDKYSWFEEKDISLEHVFVASEEADEIMDKNDFLHLINNPESKKSMKPKGK